MTYENINPKEAYQKTKEGFTYLDVRTQEEFTAGHAKGSVNIPLFFKTSAGRELNPQFIEKVKAKFAPTTKLVIGCASGGRSAKACEMLGEIGFKTLFNIDGGFSGRPDQAGWKSEGLPCEGEKAEACAVK